MKALARIVSAVALIGTIGPSVLFLTGRIELNAVHIWMLVATLAWFASVPFWMNEEQG